MIVLLLVFSSTVTAPVAEIFQLLAYGLTDDANTLSSKSKTLIDRYFPFTARSDERLQFQQNFHRSTTSDIPNALGFEDSDNRNTVDRYIVALREGYSSIDRLALIEEIKRKSTASQALPPRVADVYNEAIVGFSIDIPRSDTHIIKAIQNNPRVAVVEKDQQVRMFAQVLPTGINRVDGDHSIAMSGNGQGTVDVDIAIMDTGVDLDHPDLNVFRERTFVSGTVSAEDDDGHGTHVAGTAAAKDNSIGVVGMAPGARIWAVKILDSTGTGFISDIIAGIDYLTQNAEEVDVVNMSFGCECSSSALDTALSNSAEEGILYVAAAGNDGQDASTFSPANHPDVIAVSAIVDTDGKCGALGQSTSAGGDDTFASFSNFGPTVDIASPGVLIYSTFIGNSYATMSGTSMASPHVAGAAGLIKSVQTTASPSEVKSSLTSAGTKPGAICDGNGRGYFSGDPDQSHEPLLYVKHSSGSLQYVSTTQTNNFVNTKAYYDIMFRTMTAGMIKTIEIDFPAGTYVGAALLVEAIGIGPGKISAEGSTATGPTITYTVNNADDVSAATSIRVQLSNIVNPPNPSVDYSVTVTTKDSSNTIIDGPTESKHYLIKQKT